MLLENSPHGAVLSTFYELDKFKSVVVDSVLPHLHKIDKSITVEITEGEYDLYFYIDGWSWEACTLKESVVNKLKDMGFSSDGGENLETALALISPNRTISYTMDARMDGVILEFGGEGNEFAKELEELFNEIGSLNRNETANRIGLLYKKIKDMRWV